MKSEKRIERILVLKHFRGFLQYNETMEKDDKILFISLVNDMIWNLRQKLDVSLKTVTFTFKMVFNKIDQAKPSKPVKKIHKKWL